jgi:hypothetical protein
LRTIEASPSIQQELRSLTEFDVADKPSDFGCPVRLSSGLALEIIAADGASGAFFLVGVSGDRRPVLYADSEGNAGVVGPDLTTALTTLITLPNWHDLLGFSGGGDLAEMRRASAWLVEGLRRDFPDVDTTGPRLREKLGLAVLDDPIAVLWASVHSTEPDYVLLDDSDQGEAWDSLFQRWTIDRLVKP